MMNALPRSSNLAAFYIVSTACTWLELLVRTPASASSDAVWRPPDPSKFLGAHGYRNLREMRCNAVLGLRQDGGAPALRIDAVEAGSSFARALARSWQGCAGGFR